MTVCFEDAAEKALPFSAEELAEQVIEAVLDAEGCPYEAQVSVSLVSNEEIHALNREFRQVDAPTDVLSFPMIEFAAPADFAALEDQPDCFHPETGELLLGDIVISVERAEQQAAEYGHSLRREIAFLLAHSTLHLLGYDHMEETEAADMERRQEAVLQDLGITREAE